MSSPRRSAKTATGTPPAPRIGPLRREATAPAPRGRRRSARRANALLSKVAASARALERAVIHSGPEQARLATHVTHVARRAGGVRVHFSPIAADRLPPNPGRIHVRVLDGASPYTIVVRDLRSEGPSEASASLDAASFERLDRRRRPRSRVAGHHSLVLAATPEHGHTEVDSFPVLDVSAHVCTIESVVPLEPGARLLRADLWSARRLLRQGRAQVLETTPWYTPRGEIRFRSRLALESHQGTESSDPGTTLLQAAHVRRVLELAGRHQARGTYEAGPGSQGRCRVQSVGPDTLTLNLVDPPGGLLEQRLRLSFELGGGSYQMHMRVLRQDGLQVQTGLPVVVQRRRGRKEPRARADGQAIFVTFTNPLSRTRARRQVRDLSFGGLCFEADGREDVLWAGLPLENARLEWSDGSASLGDLEVRWVGDPTVHEAPLCRTEMRLPHAVDSTPFVDLMVRLQHPCLRVDRGGNFEGIARLYREVGLFGPHMERNLQPIEGKARDTWKLLHQARPDLCRTLVQVDDDQPVAAVSAVRAWERSWLIQHMVASPTRQHKYPGELHLAYLDHLLPRPESQYMVVHVKAGNEKIVRFLDAFTEQGGTPEAMSRCEVELWCMPPGPAPVSAPRDYGVLPFRSTWNRLLARAAERALGALTAAALSLTADELRIPEVRARFDELSLDRSRRVQAVVRRGEPVLALIEERASPGINLTWLLNATWIVPLRAGAEQDREAFRCALDHVARTARPAGAGERFVVVLPDRPAVAMTDAGMEREAAVYVQAYNRAGLQRWSHFLSETYTSMSSATHAPGPRSSTETRE